MIPLTLANMGEDVVIKKVGGSSDVKKHLEDLGLIAGSTVKIVNTFAGNVILDVKNSRIAVNSDMAKKNHGVKEGTVYENNKRCQSR